jgi:hypothetical protein
LGAVRSPWRRMLRDPERTCAVLISPPRGPCGPGTDHAVPPGAQAGDAAAAALVREELNQRTFVPETLVLKDVSTLSTPSTWTGDTDRGPHELVLNGDEDNRQGLRMKVLGADKAADRVRFRDSSALYIWREGSTRLWASGAPCHFRSGTPPHRCPAPAQRIEGGTRPQRSCQSRWAPEPANSGRAC